MRHHLATLALGLAALCFHVPARAAIHDDPALAALLETPEEALFSTRFSRWLLEQPAERIPAVRRELAAGFLDQKLSRKHAWTALAYIDERWVEIDREGFIAACKAGMKEVPVQGRLAAVIALLDHDPDAALATARDLKLDSGHALASLLTRLAHRDPRKALDTLATMGRERLGSRPFEEVAALWAARDPRAAWIGVAGGHLEPSHQLALRGVVAAGLALKDPVAALALAGEEGDPARRADIHGSMIAVLARRGHESALDVTRRIDTDAAWLSFATAPFPTLPGDTLAMLMREVPAARRDALIEAFFCHQPGPELPAFPNTAALAAVLDPELRRKIVLAVCQAAVDQSRMVPASVTATAVSLGPDFLAGPLPERTLSLLVAGMARDHQDALLQALPRLSEAMWHRVKWTAAASWPAARIAADASRLADSALPRERELAAMLAKRWWQIDPVAATPTAAKVPRMPMFFEVSFPEFLETCGGDPARVEAVLAAIPDEGERHAAQSSFEIWNIQQLPAREAVARWLEKIERPGMRGAPGFTTALAGRHEPELTRAILAIPEARSGDRDLLCAAHAAARLNEGDFRTACVFLKAIRDDTLFFRTLGRVSTYRNHVHDWRAVFRLLESRQDSPERQSLGESFAVAMARHSPESARRTARSIQSPALRESVLRTVDAVRPRPAKARLPSWKAAVELGLDTPPGAQLGVEAIELLAKDDPKAALAALIRTGGPALGAAFVNPVLRELMPRDPAAAFDAAASLPAETGGRLLASVVGEWSRVDPAAACEAALRHAPESKDTSLLVQAVRSWLRADAAAATDWAVGLPAGPRRSATLAACVQQLAGDDLERALEIYQNEPPGSLPEDAAQVLIGALDQASFRWSCDFQYWLASRQPELPIGRYWERTLREWFAADAAGAAAYLKALAPSPALDGLNRGLAAALPPRHRSLLDGWKAPELPPPAVSKAEGPRESRRPGGLLPDDLHPQRLPALLDALASNPPDQLEAAVTAITSSSLPDSPHGDEQSLLAYALLRLPKERRAEVVTSMLARRKSIPGPVIDHMLDPGAGQRRIEQLGQVMKALAADDYAAALREAAQLPIQDGDPLVRMILASFPDSKQAAAAIQTIRDDTSRQRAENWLEAGIVP